VLPDGALPGDAAAEDDDEPGPRIVRTKQFAIKPMTPEEAALQMELLGHDFFLFSNAETSAAAVVYRRKDGQIGLIDGE
jgi:putative sigma-54 modulation protein